MNWSEIVGTAAVVVPALGLVVGWLRSRRRDRLLKELVKHQENQVDIQRKLAQLEEDRRKADQTARLFVFHDPPHETIKWTALGELGRQGFDFGSIKNDGAVPVLLGGDRKAIVLAEDPREPNPLQTYEATDQIFRLEIDDPSKPHGNWQHVRYNLLPNQCVQVRVAVDFGGIGQFSRITARIPVDPRVNGESYFPLQKGMTMKHP